jgi:GGDEF domain-containing protein
MQNTEATDCDSLCRALCHKVCTELTQKFNYPLSTSIGFTTIENSSAISANTLSVADSALYQAKLSGKGCVIRGYVEEMAEQEIIY